MIMEDNNSDGIGFFFVVGVGLILGVLIIKTLTTWYL